MTIEQDLPTLRQAIIPGEFVSHSGLRLPWKFDIDLLADEQVRQLCESFGFGDGAVCGIETGGGRMARIMSDTPILYNPRTKSLSIPLHWSDEVWLVDDVVTTGTSLVQAERALSRAGIKVSRKLCLLDRTSESGAVIAGIESLAKSEDLL